MQEKRFTNPTAVLRGRPDASADVRGSDRYPAIRGKVRFYQTVRGVLIASEIYGLPQGRERCAHPVFGFHIHSGEQCSGTAADPFADALTHYDPHNCPHPFHAGDMPPLFGNDGYAFSVFLTNRFDVREIIGKTVIIHSLPDDFTTQPSGRSGEKIACGRIVSMEKQR